MRPSRVLQRLREGKVVSCFKLNLACSRAAEIVAMSNFDCIWADLEHVPNDQFIVEQQIRSAKTWDTDVLVRVSRGSYSDYIRPLEMDAAGIMVPHIMGLDDAKNVVKMTRFHPIGRRPVDGGKADGRYCGVPFLDYIRLANEQRFVAVQIEDQEPLEDLDRIAALDGIGILFFGPADFSRSIGAPGDWDHPLVLETRRRVVEVCEAHGKFAGTVGSPEKLDALIAMGYRFISMGADVVGLSQYCAAIASEFSKRQVPIPKTVSRAQLRKRDTISIHPCH